MFSLDAILEELDKIGKKEAIRRLHNLYSVAEDKKTRIKILEILNNMRDDTHFKEIENYFISDEDSDVRIEAAKLLAFNYSEKNAIDPLIWVLENEKKRDVTYTALQLLAAFIYREEFKEAIINSLKKLLSSSDNKLKMDAAEYLGLIKDQSSIDLLIQNLDSSSKLVRIRVIQALGKLKSKKSIPKLIENLTLESSDVWKFTFDSLINILGKQKLSEELIKTLGEVDQINDKYDFFKQGLIKALGELKDSRAIYILLEFLNYDNYIIKNETKDALDKLNPNWQKKYIEFLKRKHINV